MSIEVAQISRKQLVNVTIVPAIWEEYILY
jgi:hypothetical protein